MKLLFKTLFFTLTFFISILLVSWFLRTSIVSGYLSKVLNLPVSIESLDISLNQITIQDLHIKNPKNSKLESAFTAQKIQLNVPLFNFFDSHVVISQVNIQSPFIGIEMYNASGSDNNWSQIIEQLNQPSSENSNETTKNNKTFTIEQLTISDLHIQAYNKALNGKLLEPAPIKLIELRNLGKDNPQALKKLFSIIAFSLLKEITLKNHLEGILKDIQGPVKESLNLILSPLKDNETLNLPDPIKNAKSLLNNTLKK